ncbi:hypothetical protein GALMADRAFT_155034 [Galerina marginata CBS 339.88]|uniref:Integrase core domain-containing protein n=1 Tax=Galerina marginata (strain CBS 339.88) TaxID=685588 RepID=A0A067T4B7_GALM3|nr:hypothetical protein GALMADRAFT_155034 [Galerina marginata CBS 339.88]
MVNNAGVNGAGKKAYPPDNILKSTLLTYARHSLTQDQKIARLIVDHQLNIGKTKLNEIERRLEIPSVRRKKLAAEEVVQLVMDEVEKDVTQNNGPNYIKAKLKDKDIKIPRDTVRKIMTQHFSEGAEKRFPGKKKTPVNRQPLSALGPYHEIAADGHEKIGALALQMGGLGLPIYAYRDKWTGRLPQIDVVPDCRSAGAVGHLYLDLLEKLGGMSMQLNLDKGSEIGWQVAFQIALREAFAPQIDPDVYRSVALLKSIHNIIIESLWRWLREKAGYNLREVILQGKTDRLINPDVNYHRHLFYWIFVPLVQAALDDFRVYWNQRVVRYQANKDMPSGHVPDDAAAHPQFYGGIDCLIRLPEDAISDLRQHLTEEVGPKENFRRFYPDDFTPVAEEVYRELGYPELSLLTAWTVFTKMSDFIETNLLYNPY